MTRINIPGQPIFSLFDYLQQVQDNPVIASAPQVDPFSNQPGPFSNFTLAQETAAPRGLGDFETDPFASVDIPDRGDEWTWDEVLGQLATVAAMGTPLGAMGVAGRTIASAALDRNPRNLPSSRSLFQSFIDEITPGVETVQRDFDFDFDAFGIDDFGFGDVDDPGAPGTVDVDVGDFDFGEADVDFDEDPGDEF